MNSHPPISFLPFLRISTRLRIVTYAKRKINPPTSRPGKSRSKILIEHPAGARSMVLLLFFIFGMCSFGYSQVEKTPGSDDTAEVQIKLTYCNMELANGYKLANLTFNSLYLFSVTEKGKILEIKKLRDDYIGEDVVRQCVSNWRISGFPEGAKFVVYFSWKHGKGWVEQRINGNGFTQVMTREGVGIEKLIEKFDISKNLSNP